MRTATRPRNDPLWRHRSRTGPVTVRPTGADIAIARAIARNTKPAPEAVARALTWGADEKVLLVLAVAGWLASRGRSDALRRAGNHALLVTTAASLLPHALKAVFDQTRPDRRTVLGHLHGDLVFRQARGCLSVRPRAAHGRACLGRQHIAGGTPPGDPRRSPSVFR